MSCLARSWKTRVAPLLAAALMLHAPRCVHADTVTFVLRDLVFSGPTGQNGLPSPVYVAEPGIDGHLLWTFTPGDFPGGTGTLLDLALPITWFPLASAIVTVDASGITGAQPGNTHDLTYDFQLAFAHALAGPTDSSPVNASTSAFDFTGAYIVAPGVSFNGEWLGNITGGSIVPENSVLATPPPTAAATSLGAAAPNPFRDATTVECTLAAPGPVELAVYGVDGRRVATLLRDVRPAGPLHATWNGRDAEGRPAPAALYFIRLTTAHGAVTRQVARLP